jgi:CrcB protein
MKILFVLLGGSLGALCRYGVSLASVRLYGESFPWGTLAVNLAGCFLIGLAFALGVERNVISPSFRLFFVTGFLGALTTFSTYALESINFSRDGQAMTTVLNLLANNVGGLLLVIGGLWVGKSV